MKRKYIYVYFPGKVAGKGLGKRDLTIAFRSNDPLYGVCKKLSSAEIREKLGSYTYKDLAEKAQKEDRTPGNYIKHKLRKKLL